MTELSRSEKSLEKSLVRWMVRNDIVSGDTRRVAREFGVDEADAEGVASLSSYLVCEDNYISLADNPPITAEPQTLTYRHENGTEIQVTPDNLNWLFDLLDMRPLSGWQFVEPGE